MQLILSISIAFWAAAPKGTKSCRTQGDFRSSFCSFVRSSPLIRPLGPQIRPLRPQIRPLRPQIRLLRPLRLQIRPLTRGLWSWDNFQKMFKPGDYVFSIIYVSLSKSWPKMKKSVGNFLKYSHSIPLQGTGCWIFSIFWTINLVLPLTSERIELEMPDWSH